MLLPSIPEKGSHHQTVGSNNATYLKAHRTASSLRAKKGGQMISAGA
jgi:hypothetical protein